MHKMKQKEKDQEDELTPYEFIRDTMQEANIRKREEALARYMADLEKNCLLFLNSFHSTLS